MQEAKHKHQQVNPLVDQRVRQAYRRVQLQAAALPLCEDQGSVTPPPLSRTTSSALSCAGKSLDVSFKTSLVASYQRASYTGTGTDCAEESWEEWLGERRSEAAAGRGRLGGVIDDILRLVPASLCSETENCWAADSCLYDSAGLSAFGAFSVTARQQALALDRTSARATARAARSVCAADVLGLVNDVLDSHLCLPSPPAAAASSRYTSRLQSLSRDVHSLTSDLAWQCISGSSDLLTVLAATSFSLIAQQVTVSVRVVNSAMFKIPTFSLQVCLQTPGSDSSSDSSSRQEQGAAASFLYSALPSVQECVDYFLPGERGSE